MKEAISNIIYKNLTRQALTDNEKLRFDRWLNQSDKNRELYYRLTSAARLQDEITSRHDAEKQIESALQVFAAKHFKQGAESHPVHVLRTAWFRYAAAAVIVLGIGAYLWNQSQKRTPSLVRDDHSVPVKHEVMPGSDKAILTLSSGEKIELNAAAQKTINDGKLVIQNHDGSLTYGKTDVAVYNTMSTTNGGQYELRLPDGTHVWLNAASSITYPTAFNGSTRVVTITGECYFEVAKDAKKVFIVKTRKEDIQVVGTHFNINSYEDEGAMKTSLLEGAVKVGEHLLKPGQAYIDGKVITTSVEQDIAWKNGYFNFNDADLPAVMRQLGRWYDIQIQYTGAVKKEKFQGKLPRNLKLSEVLEILRDMDITYELKNRTLLIK